MSKRTTNCFRGVSQALPIVIAYIPLSFAFGVMSNDVGLSLFATLLMSLIVYAGSAQYIAVSLISHSVPLLTIVLTTFMVNLRHILLVTSLAQHLNKWPPFKRILFSLEVTDETFVLHSAKFPHQDPKFSESLGLNLASHSSWVLGSWLGFSAGNLVKDISVFGLDYALPGMFIAILISQIKSRLMILIAILTGSMALMMNVYGFKTSSVIMTSILGASLGMTCELIHDKVWKKKLS